MNIFSRTKNFIQETTSEFKRVSWPTRKATLESTGVVCFITLCVAVYLGLVDFGLAEAMKQIIR